MFISIGYSAFKQEIKVKDLSVKARFENEVRITSIENVSEETSSNVTSINDYNKTKIITDLTLPNSDSYITYKIEISNFGAVRAGLYSIDNLPDNLEIKNIEGYNLKEAICNTTKCTLGARVEFKIKIGYKEGKYNSNSTTTSLNLNFNFGEMTSVTYNGINSTNLPHEAIKGYPFEVELTYNSPKITMNGIELTESEYSYTNGKLTIQEVDGNISIEEGVLTEATLVSGPNFNSALGTYRSKTTELTFVTKSNMNYESITDPIDVSENQDGSILAYIQNDTATAPTEYNETPYKMIIATFADILYANEDSSNMFNSFANLKTINNLTSLNTSKVTNMQGMFYSCSSLTSLDLSNFDTSNVTYMGGMFERCYFLTTLDLSSFDTSNVTDMFYMFYSDYNLTTIYASELWDTSKVTSSSNMFDGCTKLSGAVSYNSSKKNLSMANYTTGYLTYKAHT